MPQPYTLWLGTASRISPTGTVLGWHRGRKPFRSNDLSGGPQPWPDRTIGLRAPDGWASVLFGPFPVRELLPSWEQSVPGVGTGFLPSREQTVPGWGTGCSQAGKAPFPERDHSVPIPGPGRRHRGRRDGSHARGVAALTSVFSISPRERTISKRPGHKPYRGATLISEADAGTGRRTGGPPRWRRDDVDVGCAGSDSSGPHKATKLIGSHAIVRCASRLVNVDARSGNGVRNP